MRMGPRHCLLALALIAVTAPACGDSGAAPSEVTGNIADTRGQGVAPTSTGAVSTQSATATTPTSTTDTVIESVPQSTNPVAPTSTTAPIPTTGPTTTQPGTLSTRATLPMPAGFLQVPFDAEAFDGAVMADVAAAGPGLVAVGTSLHNSPTFWTSEDATNWSRHEVKGSDVAQFAWSVTAGGPGVVAVGADEFETAAVWTSENGVDWMRAPQQDSLEEAEMRGVTSFEGALVAVGRASKNAEGDRSAVVWNSSDGVNWTRVPRDEDVFGGGASMWDVTVAGPGLVAVGGDRQASLVWTSRDGISWDRVHREIHEEPFLDDTFMYAVAATEELIVAGGFDMEGEGANMWTSADGLTWLLLPRRTWTEFERTTVTGIVAHGTGWVAVGDGLWTSPDGLSWSQVADRFTIWPYSLNGAAAFGDDVIVVGSNWETGSASVWSLLR